MSNVYAEIVLTGTKIFSKERERYFQKRLYEANKLVQSESDARSPDYSDAKKALAERELETLLTSYSTEFKSAIDAIIAKVGQNA